MRMKMKTWASAIPRRRRRKKIPRKLKNRQRQLHPNGLVSELVLAYAIFNFTYAIPDIKPAQAASTSSGSWLGRFWKRAESTTPGPVKASLGEETSFYYDKELKRWVNKKVIVYSIF
jgi:hypothetical protein